MKVAVIGVGMHPFGRREGLTSADMGLYAARQALRDGGVTWSQVGFAAGGSMGASLGGGDAFPDALVSRLGLTGVPFANVANGCATAGTALLFCAMAIEEGRADIALAVGYDKHPRGHFNADPGTLGLPQWYGETGLMLTTQFFAMKTQRYLYEHGISRSTLSRVAAKAFRNGALNPNAWRRKPFSEEEIGTSTTLNDPLTQYMFCSPDEGAAAVLLCRADRARELTKAPVYLAAATSRTRRFGSFEVFSPWLPGEVAPSPTVDAARACFEMAGVAPGDVDVAQLQDSEAGSEIMHMAETGLCQDGEQEELIERGATEITGELPINTDGGLIANGEPIGASGLRQVHEIVLQLRGDAGERQVPRPLKVGFTQVYGAPGVGACTVLTR